ncbi:MAG TPA: hypothetical protein VMZ91_12110 [Candidatus Paceibacterota bacterium]|nr:hypothetical protein [Candidatus Paceibacterota bacterium]
MEEEFYEEDELNRVKLQNEQIQQMQQGKLLDEQNTGLIKEQLELEQEFKRIDHLLRGHILSVDENGEECWVEPSDNSEILLTEAGINLVMRTLRWYINKNTLLSNYDEETIFKKMEDFSNSLSDAIFMNYQKYFLYATQEECEEALIERLKRKQSNILSNARIMGENLDPKEVWKKVVGEIDPNIEKQKIGEQLKKDKLKLYDLLLRQIQDAVHSTYLRALGGQERKTLRQHIHISENVGQLNKTPKESRGFLGRS